jgi:hypothetical protein
MAEEISEDQYSVLGLSVFGIGEIGRDCETSMSFFGCQEGKQVFFSNLLLPMFLISPLLRPSCLTPTMQQRSGRFDAMVTGRKFGDTCSISLDR